MSNVTGKKPSGLPDPVVSVGINDSWLVVETSDGKVCRVRPSILLGASSSILEFQELDFNGTTLVIPALINGGKLPAEDAKVEVFINGSLDYIGQDYTLTRNGAGIADEIEFTSARTSEDILVRLML